MDITRSHLNINVVNCIPDDVLRKILVEYVADWSTPTKTLRLMLVNKKWQNILKQDVLDGSDFVIQLCFVLEQIREICQKCFAPCQSFFLKKKS